MALSGFITFGSKTQGNVLNNFPTSNVLVNIARFCFGLNMLTTLPLEAFVCREVMFNYWPGEGKRASNTLHYGVSTGLVASSMLISLMVCDLGAVFEIIGATSACALAYILPPLCYIKLSTTKSKWIPAVACIVFGSVVMVMSVVQALIKIVKSKLSMMVQSLFRLRCMY
jgi:sodium-coupled neutral amino acid transporter 11